MPRPNSTRRRLPGKSPRSLLRDRTLVERARHCARQCAEGTGTAPPTAALFRVDLARRPPKVCSAEPSGDDRRRSVGSDFARNEAPFGGLTPLWAHAMIRAPRLG